MDEFVRMITGLDYRLGRSTDSKSIHSLSQAMEGLWPQYTLGKHVRVFNAMLVVDIIS
jgi:hypothetical protein